MTGAGLERPPSWPDRRRQVALTGACRRRLRVLSLHVVALEARILETSFTESERTALTELVRRLRAGIAELVVSEGASARTLP
jgi:hypothetical protein